MSKIDIILLLTGIILVSLVGLIRYIGSLFDETDEDL